LDEELTTMETESSERQLEVKEPARPQRLAYEPPSVTRYTDEELLEALGPAHAGQSYGQQPG